MKITEKQRAYYHTGETRDISFRVRQLKSLKEALKKYENEMYDAFMIDLNKSESEVYLTELGMVYHEIDTAIRNIRKWSKKTRAKTPLFLFGTSSKIYYEPVGTVLIIVPFNYPVQLAFIPLVGAMMAGNTAIVKLSELTPHVSTVIQKIISETFDDSYVCAMQGEVEVVTRLLEESFDLIFFTGSSRVGKIVMKAASENLTPVILELGGKSPAIITEYANLGKTIESLVWGKFVNAGQTCVAPDYLIIHKSKVSEFERLFRETLLKFYGESPLQAKDYGKIINASHHQRLVRYLTDNDSNIIWGGMYNETKIEPTLIKIDNLDCEIMEDEIFGPILPMVPYDSFDEIEKIVSKNPNPLALYLYTYNKEEKDKILNSTSFGGGMVNGTIFHLANNNVPFGGIRNSGIGSYHGYDSFTTFSHRKSVMTMKKWSPLKHFYPPYTEKKNKIIRKLLK